jgi:hypothetical protein
MTRITDDKGNVIEVTDQKDGAKLVELKGPYGIGELRLDRESAREIGLALLPAPEEAP